MKTAVKRTVIRKPTFKDKLINVGYFILRLLIIFPVACLIDMFRWAYFNFLTESYDRGNKEIFGPGFHSWDRRRFSFGKLAVILVILFIIIYLIIK